MSGESRDQLSASARAALPAGAGRGWLHTAEDILLALALAIAVLLPLIGIVLRKFFNGGISGATAFEQHLKMQMCTG